MMAIKHVVHPGPRDTVGGLQDVIIWGYGVSQGRVVAVDLHADGSVALAVELDRPQPIVVPEVICDRMESCRFDQRCQWLMSCQEHECDAQ